MMYHEITLSDGLPCQVRQLELYGLEHIRPAISGMFTYKIAMMQGEELKDAEYDGERWEGRTPPQKPSTPEHLITERSEEWYALREYNVYQAWMTWKKQKEEAMAQYSRECAIYILNSCLKPEDRLRIVSPEDWQKVHKAALVPELTREVLAETLQFHFSRGI